MTMETIYEVGVWAEHVASGRGGMVAWEGEPGERLCDRYAPRDPRESHDFDVYRGTAAELCHVIVELERDRGPQAISDYNRRAATAIRDVICGEFSSTLRMMQSRRPETGWTPEAIRAVVAATPGATLGEVRHGEATVWADLRWHGMHIGTAWFRGESSDPDELGFDDQIVEDDEPEDN